MDPFSGSINIISKQIKCYRSAQPFSGCSSTRWKITDEEGLGAALSVRVIQRNNDVWLRADYYNYIIFFFKQTYEFEVVGNLEQKVEPVVVAIVWKRF